MWAKLVGKSRAEAVLAELVESRTLSDDQRNYLRVGWLDELLEARRNAGWNRRFFLTFRFLAISGALVLPALASLNLGDNPPDSVRYATFVVTLVVAVSTGFIQVFRFGVEWGIDREFATAMEAEGWSYMLGSGRYRTTDYAERGYGAFFARVERLRRLRSERGVAEILAMAADTGRQTSAPPPHDSRS